MTKANGHRVDQLLGTARMSGYHDQAAERA